MPVVEQFPIGNIRHTLIDAKLRLTPLAPSDRRGWAWLDEATGLTFELEREKNAVEISGHVFGYWYFRLWHPGHTRAVLLLDFQSQVDGTPRRFLHRIVRSKVFDRLSENKQASLATTALLGGESALFDFCLKAIRAAACRPVKIETVQGVEMVVVLVSATNVEFDIRD